MSRSSEGVKANTMKKGAAKKDKPVKTVEVRRVAEGIRRMIGDNYDLLWATLVELSNEFTQVDHQHRRWICVGNNGGKGKGGLKDKSGKNDAQDSDTNSVVSSDEKKAAGSPQSS